MTFYLQSYLILRELRDEPTWRTEGARGWVLGLGWCSDPPRPERRLRRALVVGDGPGGARHAVRGLRAGRARRVRGGAGGAAAGGKPAHALRRGQRPVRTEPLRGTNDHARGR